MSSVINHEYLGLPVPNYDEKSLLCEALYDDEHNFLTVEEIAREVMCFRPAIQQVMKHDMTLSAQEERDGGESTKDEIKKFVTGIESGHEFVVGCLTYIYFYRSGHNSLTGYLRDKKLTGIEIPLRRDYQKRRVLGVRKGNIDVDCVYDNELIPGRLIASLEAAKYTDEAIGMKDLLNEECSNVRVNNTELDEDLVEAYNDGMEHGFENAICMYVQSREAAIIAAAEKQIRKMG